MRWKTTAFLWSAAASAIELRGAVSRSFVVRLRAPHTAQFTVSGDHPDSLRLTELESDIRIQCAVEGGAYQTCFHGRLVNTQDTLSEDVHTVSYQFNSYKWLLDKRIIKAATEYASAEIADTAWTLISASQAEASGALGITDSGVNTAQSKQLTVQLGDSVMEKIDDMADSSPRAEWDIHPDTKVFTMYYPTRGANNGVILEYGRAVAAMTRTRVGTNYLNVVQGTGGEGVSPYRATDPGVTAGTDPRGRFEEAFGWSDVTNATTLQKNTDAVLAVAKELSGSYNVTLRKGWWRGPSHLWIGDTVTWKMNRGRINETFTMRVYEINVNIGDDGEETTRLVLVK